MKNEKIIHLVGLKGTAFILEYLNTHKKARYKDLLETLSTHTLNNRLGDLLDLKLIKHHFERKETRIEWYEITEKGKKAFQYIKKLQNL